MSENRLHHSHYITLDLIKTPEYKNKGTLFMQQSVLVGDLLSLLTTLPINFELSFKSVSQYYFGTELILCF